MKLCQACWDELKNAIEERGLMKFVAKDGAHAAEILTKQLADNKAERPFEPLMAANFAIWQVSLQNFGLEMMAEDAPCPLCFKTELESTCTDPECHKQTGHDWIRFAADEQMEVARSRGLISQPN